MPQVLEKQPGLLRLRELCDTLDVGERTLQNFFDRSPDLLAVVKIDGSFMRANYSWRKLLGWAEETMVEMSWLHLVREEDRPALREAIGYLGAHNLNRFVCRVRHANGGYLVVEFSATKWQGGLSNLIGRVVSDACLSCQKAGPRLVWSVNGCDDCQTGLER